MAQPHASALYHLIHALDHRERHLVRSRLDTAHAPSNRRTLFEFLIKQRNWNEPRTRAFSRDHGLRLASVSKQLVTDIQDVLAEHPQKDSHAHTLYRELVLAEQLLAKHLPQEAGSRAREGFQQARQWGLLNHALLFRRLELSVSFQTAGHRMPLEQLEAQMQETEAIGQELSALLTLQHLSQIVDHVFDAGTYRYLEATEILENKVLTHPIFEEGAQALTDPARTAYLDLVASIHYYLEDWSRSVEASEQLADGMLERLEDQPDAPGYYDRLLVNMGNLMSLANLQRDADAFRRYRRTRDEVLAAVPKTAWKKQLTDKLALRYTVEMAWYQTHSRQLAALDRTIDQQVLPLLDQPRWQAQRMVVRFDLMVMHFMIGRYADGLAIAAQLEKEHADELAVDAQRRCAMNWWLMLASFEAGDAERFETMHERISTAMEAGEGRHWPTERLLLQALLKAFALSGEARRKALVTATKVWEKEKLRVNRPTKNINILEWLAKQTAGVQRN